MIGKKYIFGALIVVGVVILIIYLIRRKSATSSTPNTTGVDTTSVDTTNCTPGYTITQYNKDKATMTTACERKLIIPILGIGYYTQCMQLGKANLKNVC